MAYTTINKSTDYFNTKLYTGTGSELAITGVGHQPDWVWIKDRDSAGNSHNLTDVVRGAGKGLFSNLTSVQYDYGTGSSSSVKSFNSDGYTLGTATQVNNNGTNFVSWNWKAGGASPAITYTVKVVSDSGNKYRFDDFGTSAVTLDLQEGGTYTFDQSDSSNSGHPLRFYTAADKTGGEYTTGVTTNGTPGSSGAYTRITVAASAPTLYYQCSSHAGMGGQVNTNSTFGSSNFGGSIQSTVSANTSAGFSIVKFTGNETTLQTVGHGLGEVPKMIIVKNMSTAGAWMVYHESLGASSGTIQRFVQLNSNGAQNNGSAGDFPTAPTSSVFGIGNYQTMNKSGDNIIAYCFAEKTGYSRFSSYTGNGNADGTFVYTGFKPAFVMIKRTDSTGSWYILDNKRNTFNVVTKYLKANETTADSTIDFLDFTSNGFKMISTGADVNTNNASHIYMAFAEAPLVGSNNIPATAR